MRQGEVDLVVRIDPLEHRSLIFWVHRQGVPADYLIQERLFLRPLPRNVQYRLRETTTIILLGLSYHHMSLPRDPVSGFFLSTTPIQYDGGQGHATGFFFNFLGTTYFITNKHVVDIKTHNGEPLEEARIFIRPDPTKLDKTEYLDLTLVADGNRTWMAHSNEGIDIAAIPLESPVVKESINIPSHDPIAGAQSLSEHAYEVGNLAFTPQDLPPQREVADSTIITSVRGGSQAVVLGYPVDIFRSYFPIARSALISSPYGTQIHEKPYFMMDARTHPGLSGSPVITTISESTKSVRVSSTGFDASAAADLMQDIEWYLIGIHAQSEDTTASLDLNGVFYPQNLMEILKEGN